MEDDLDILRADFSKLSPRSPSQELEAMDKGGMESGEEPPVMIRSPSFVQMMLGDSKDSTVVVAEGPDWMLSPSFSNTTNVSSSSSHLLRSTSHDQFTSPSNLVESQQSQGEKHSLSGSPPELHRKKINFEESPEQVITKPKSRVPQ